MECCKRPLAVKIAQKCEINIEQKLIRKKYLHPQVNTRLLDFPPAKNGVFVKFNPVFCHMTSLGKTVNCSFVSELHS